jgi:hypothetical protein
MAGLLCSGDYEPPPPGPGFWIPPSIQDCRGVIYGAPSFLTVRVVEQETGTPVEGARVIIVGLGSLEMETSNIGGWCNISKDSQRNGRYFIIAQKNGHGMAMKSVTYAGEPLQTTIEVR